MNLTSKTDSHPGVTRRAFVGGLAAAAGSAFAAPQVGPTVAAASKRRIPYRFFWTWDHSTNWMLNVLGSQTAGIGNGYNKRSRDFERDYTRMIDWAAAHGVSAVGAVALFRDRHGGVESVRRLCAHAREKGVRVYLICGLFAYGGIYYEGKSTWSLNRFLEDNPDCVGVGKDGGPLMHQQVGYAGYVREKLGCPSNPKLRQYVLDSLAWVFREIPELGGVQIESGDTGVCQCPRCRARRGDKAISEQMSVEDMIGIYPDAADAVWSSNPDAWVLCETYHHFLDDPIRAFERPSKALERLAQVPDKLFWQWWCDHYRMKRPWTPGAQLPPVLRRFNHVMRAHSGTQWMPTNERGALAIDLIREQCNLSASSGINGVSLFGEVSPYYANAEFNYLALQYFADDPDATVTNFRRDVMSPLLGSDEFAERYCAFAPLKNDPQKAAPAVNEILTKIIPSVSDGEVRRRWLTLAAHLDSYRWDWERNGRS